MVFLRALAVFLGTVIGAGLFGLPFVAMKAGFLPVLVYFIVIGTFIFLIQSLYSRVILETKEIHRLPGYVGIYLSSFWKKLTFAVIVIGLTGSLLAYLIIGGEFLNALFGQILGGSPLIYSFLFFIVGAVFIFKGIKSIAGIELFLLAAFLTVLLFFLKEAFPFIDINNFRTVNLNFVYLPYGVVLFSLWGSAIIPEIKEIITSSFKNKNQVRKIMKRVLFSGIVFSLVVYALFIFIVFGASGTNTSSDAISGLKNILGADVIRLGLVFGILTCFTSFLTLSLALRNSLRHDFGFPKNLAWAVTCFLPFLLFLLGFRRFINVIGFTGAMALGLEGIIVIFLYKEFLKDNFKKKINPLFYLLALIFILGIIFEIIYFLR